jgi:phage repressor protein C with HTH and peptisase S24 domain
MNMGKRIESAMFAAEHNQTTLAAAMGISPQAVQQWISGETSPRGMRLKKLADVLHVSISYLVDDAHENQVIRQDLPAPTDDDFALVLQLDVAAACGDGKYVDHVVVKGGLAFKRSSLRDFGVAESDARIIYAAGGSMWPTIQDGCVVLLNTADKEPKEGRVYAICTPDGEIVLKRLIKDYHPAVGGITWLMSSDNPDKNNYPNKILPPDDRTMIIGRAVWNDNRL